MRISEKGLELIKNFEGCRLKAYKPVKAETYWTIGYGHYGPDVKQGMTITQEQAEEYLRNDIAGYERTVEDICSYLPKLTQNEFDALVSFTYNCGGGGLLQLTKQKTRTKAQMMSHIEAYNKGADGKVLPGLTKRRLAEKELFLTPLSANEEKLEYLGIARFHDAGFKGQGISFASRETLTEHGRMVYDIMKMIAPEANLFYAKEYSKDIDENIDIYTTSCFRASDNFAVNKKKAEELFNKGTLLVCAVGNEGEDTTALSKEPYWTSIGACNLTKGKPVKMYYSGIGDNLDFMSFTNMQTANGLFTGTSCATPMFAGMCVLVQSFFKMKIGRKLTNLELLKFIRDNCEDLKAEGFDTETGFGLFRLPDPKDIDVRKYEEEDMVRYEKIEDVPEWGRESIKKALDVGVLKGTGTGLGLTETEVKMLVWLDRCKCLDF